MSRSTIARGLAHVPDRAERRRQVDAPRLHLGLPPVDAGVVRVDGRDVTRWPPHRRARHGLATVFQTTAPLDAPRRARQRGRGRARPFARRIRREHAPAFPGSGGRSSACVGRRTRRSRVVGLDGRASDPAAVAPARAASAARDRPRARAAADRCSCWTSRPPGCARGEKARLVEALRVLARARADDGARRARHAVRRGARRAGRRARSRSRDRRRHAGRTSEATRRSIAAYLGSATL